LDGYQKDQSQFSSDAADQLDYSRSPAQNDHLRRKKNPQTSSKSRSQSNLIY
jgi:hypothetical protein